MEGQRFGKLVVLSKGPSDKWNGPRWLCRCDCGNEKLYTASNLRHRAKSCGCLRTEVSTTHGQTGTPEYYAWNNMLQRCTNPKHPNYRLYGERGINVDPRWSSFENFLADMGPRPTPHHSIERRDVNGGYRPDNCHWATLEDQSRNKRNNVFYEYEGERLTESELSRKTGVLITTIRARLARGMTLEEAVSPVDRRKKVDPK